MDESTAYEDWVKFEISMAKYPLAFRDCEAPGMLCPCR